MLDCYPQYTFDNCKAYITDSFWIGLLRNWKSWVKIPHGYKTPIEMKIYNSTKAAQQDRVIKAVYQSLTDQPLVKWKDSARKVLGL
jgi:hypothetical protein